MAIEEELGRMLTDRGKTLAVAESCTGGMIGERITAVSGSSDYFLGGIIAYANEIKVGQLGVSAELIDSEGAVCPAVGRQMALGARDRFSSDLAAAVTGVAGPGGGTVAKPVGLVFVAVTDGMDTVVRECRFKGNRNAVRRATCDEALSMLAELLRG